MGFSNLIKNKTVSFIILVMILYIAIALLSDIHKISIQFLKLNVGFIILILGLEVLAFTLRGIRQKYFLFRLGIKMTFFESFEIFMAGYSMIATPGGSGEIIKSHFLKQTHGTSFSKTVPLVFAERFHDLLAVTTIIIITLLASYNWGSMLITIFSVSFLVGIYVLLKNTKLFPRLQNRLLRIKFLKKFVPNSEFNEGLRSLMTPKMTLFGWLVSFPSWFLEAIAVYLAFLSFGQNLTFIVSTQITFTATLFGALSLLPGGIGITEGSLIGLIISRGIEFATASALVLFIRLTSIWFATILGFIFAHRVLRQESIK